MKKCLLKFPWIKVPREDIPALKGLLGYWLKLVSRAAFRKGISAYCGYQNHVDRNHRVAETAVMCLRAGIESRPGIAAYTAFTSRLTFYGSILGNAVRLVTVGIESVERVFKIEEKCLL